MTAPARSTLAREIGVFTAPDFDGLEPFFAEHGFAVMRGLYTEEQLRRARGRARAPAGRGSSPASSPRSAAPSSSTIPTR